MIPRTDHVADHVDDYLHDLLGSADAASVERHCAACAACAAALEEARRRLAALHSVPPTEASEELVRAAVAGPAEHERRRRRRRRSLVALALGAVAAAAAVILGFQLHYSRLVPTPFDVTVLGPAQLLAGSQASLRVEVSKRFPEAPGSFLRYAGVPVNIALVPRGGGAPVPLASFRTDLQGSGQPSFKVPDWADEDCDLVVTADTPDGPETTRHRVRVRRSWQVMLSSDKPVYQPGQTLRVRSLALRRPDLHPVAGEGVTFTVTDPKGNVIFKRAARNSDYGIASADCPLDAEVLDGQYVIAATVGDTASRLAVEVRKYVLPKFKVGLTLDKTFYAPGDKVSVTVEAAYFFGKPVAGRVDLQARPAVGQPLYQGNAAADGSGKAVFSFELPRDVSGDLRVSLTATVTDAAGQKQQKEVSTLVTTSPLRVEVFPEGGTLIPGIKTTAYVFASYADGRPARATVEGPEGFQVTTNELGVGSFDCTPPVGRAFDGPFRVTDGQGVTAVTNLALAYSANSADFLLQTDKAVYDGGDTLHLSAFSHEDALIFVDLIQDGQTLQTATMPMDGGRGACALDLPAELSGTLLLSAYRMNPTGMPIRKTRTLYVRPAKSLQVRATTDRAEYRPGRRAKVSFELLDGSGRPARGALSLAAVDEAVFAVMPQAPGAEARFFGADQELLKPVETASPSWPERTKSLPPAERDRVEQALFARTVQTSSWVDPAAGPWAFKSTDEAVRAQSSFGTSPRPPVLSSFVKKAEQVEQARDQGLYRTRMAWAGLALAVALLAYVGVWLFVRPLWVVLALHAAGVFFLCGALAVLVPGRGSMSPPGEAVAEKMAVGMAPPAQMDAYPVDFDGSVSMHGAKGASSSPRVRREFPETLLWQPELITDDAGRASLDIDLADSITTWRLTAGAVAADGRLGATQAGIKVFQPFFVDLNLPVSLTRGDEVTVPVVVYNYLDKPQTVELTLDAGDWFERLGDAAQKVELAPRAVASTSYRLRVKTVGTHPLQVTARAGDLADAIRRDVEVVPDGRRVEQVVNGSLAEPAEVTLTVPENAVEGSAKAFVKIYPSGFSQLVEGLDGIFRMPYGCFEQTSSTTYPNVLALEYLRKTGGAAPEVKAKAERYIHLGYQRLVGFEVPGGGFDWFGRPPANRTLTAYGLMEFQDMAKVHDVDPRLIERTRAWLLQQRKADGSWPSDRGMLNDGLAGSVQGGGSPDLGTTAYVAWAVFDAPGATASAEPTRSCLLSHKADSLSDPYVLALVANALNAIDPDGRDALPYLDRLAALRKEADGGKLTFWEQPANARTAFYGAGRGGRVETTALAALALLHRNHDPETTRRALAWLVGQKDASGTWPSTQATVLALRALVAGTGKPAGDGERRITIVWDGQKREVVIPADQAEVMKQLDLSNGLKSGTHRLTLTETSDTAAGYQVAFRYHVPDTARPGKADSLQVELSYDRDAVRVGDTVTATATVSNRRTRAAPMVILDLPVPAGFALDADGLAALVRANKIEKYQVTPRGAVVYLRGLDAGGTLAVKYALRATTPVKVSVAPARAYEYYDPDQQGTSAAARLTVTGP